ncbi:hypothetical protein Snoj_05860 [Streptomyces nojiriensis]|uniref:Uncharacterized protein n=1 Tax=Streptomyces nojiriensis TaxID=66374 RepID=A0ABQ3SEV3_9ACTN|nr:hypothetical protein GCM10010205_33220 [Streptomyces nojiriensis]GHI66668.1 hypothetical protein Snoj_05860 [Streptomyces nojiriensis]
MKKVYTALLAGAALAFLGLQGAATAAPMGWPEGCSSFQSPLGGGWVATCEHPNGGHFKATVKCERWDGKGFVNHDAADWASSGFSAAFCPPNTSVKGGSVWTRSY